MTYFSPIDERGELLPYKGDFYLWNNVPSLPAAVIFAIIFLGLATAHTWKMVKDRMWFCIPFAIGGYLEAVGFIGRAVASDVTDQLLPYIIQSVFLLVPPSLFAASIYMTLGRIMRGLGSRGEDFSIIRVRWLTTIFVVGDVFSFLVQSGGAGFMAAGDDPTIGEIIVVAGLVIQIVFFALFVAAAVIFHIRCRQYSMTAGNIGSSSYLQLSGEQRTSGSFLAAPFNWLQMMWMLYASSALILVRSVFRIIEYAMGTDAYPLNHEWTLYVFDGSLMVITMVIIYLWYPSQVPRVGKGGSTENENTIEMGQEQDQGK